MTEAPHDPTPHLDDDARERLHEVAAEVEHDPGRIATRFPAAARLVARGPTDPADPGGVLGPTLEDEARIGLLLALSRGLDHDPGRVATEAATLYRFGDAEERRAVLRALHLLPAGGAGALLDAVADALRSNDTRLIAAAMGPFAAEHLELDAWRHGVLKCLFVGVPLAAVAGLERRADAELGRMVTDFAAERVAAGRDVPTDVWLVGPAGPGLRAALAAESASPHPDRRAAAERALRSGPDRHAT